MILQKIDPFREIQRQLEALTVSSAGVPNLSSFSPAVNSRESDEAYFIQIDLPGVEKEAITVDVKENILSVSGERKFEKETKEQDYYRLESRYGRFERRFSLPENTDADAIEASFKNGVLTVKLPKTQPKGAKQISVK